MKLEELEGLTVYILESLRPGDIHTGENLRDELRQYWYDIKSEMFKYEYYNIDDKDAFSSVLNNIQLQIKNSNRLPIIQIECHGWQKGLELGSGEYVDWRELFDKLRPINNECYNLLLLNLSMCNGESVISYIDPTQRAPFRAVTGPIGKAYPESLQSSWMIFYKGYISSFKKDYGLCKLAQKAGLLYFTQEFIFDAYFDLANKDPELFNHFRNKELAEMYEAKEPLYMDPNMYRTYVAEKQAKIKKRYKPYFCFDDYKPLHKAAYNGAIYGNKK